MLQSLLIILVSVLLAVTTFSEALCRFTDQIKPVSVDFQEVASQRYRFVYATENYSSGIDHALLDIQKGGDNIYNATTTYIKNDGTTDSRNYTIEYEDGVMNDTYYFDYGFISKFTTTSYILAKLDEGPMLVYLCSNNDAVYNDADMRYIIVPDGTSLTDDGLNQLMAVDKKFNFNSNLFKLPNQL